MFNKYFLMMLLFFTSMVFADNTQQTVYTDNKNPIAVSAGQSFTLQLPSNPSTGYSWKWDQNKFDSNLVTLDSHQYIPPQNKKLVGAGGYEQWHFTAKAGNYRVTQVGHIVMEYQRPWEKTPGTKKTFILHIK